MLKKTKNRKKQKHAKWWAVVFNHHTACMLIHWCYSIISTVFFSLFWREHSCLSQTAPSPVQHCDLQLINCDPADMQQQYDFQHNKQMQFLLLCSLVVWHCSTYSFIFPNGSRVNRLWLGGCCILVSFGLRDDFLLDSYHWCAVDENFFFIACHRAFLSWAVHFPCQFMMFLDRMPSVLPL